MSSKEALESIRSFIDRQDWPEADKAAAHREINARAAVGLYPWTGSQWAAWATSRGLSLTYGGAA